MQVPFWPLRQSLVWLSLLLAGLAPAQNHAEEQKLTFLDGTSASASVVRIMSVDQVEFLVNEQRGAKPESRTLTTSQFVSWGARVEPGKRPQILLADESLLIADVMKLDGEQVVAGIDFDAPYGQASLWERSRLPLEKVRGIIFQPPADALARDRLAFEIFTAKGNQDRLLLKGGDQIEGILAAEPTQDAPTQDAPTQDDDRQARQAIWFTPREQTQSVAVPLEKVVALIVNPSLAAPPAPQTRGLLIGFRDGSCLNAQSWQQAGGVATIAIPGGLRFKVETQAMMEQLCLLRPWSDRVTYLSDLPSRGYKHFPYLDLNWPYQRDRSVLGGRLRWASQVHTKGLSMHSKSRLAYRLGGGYRSFQAALAIDRAAGNRGSVTFAVLLADTDGKWRAAYQSPVVRGGEPPLPISVDVAQAQAMLLIVDYADHGDQWDHASWLDARLIKKD